MSYLTALYHACCAAAYTNVTWPISSAQARNMTQVLLVVLTREWQRGTQSHTFVSKPLKVFLRRFSAA